MLVISEILIAEHKIDSYKSLKKFIKDKIKDGEIFLSIDIKPPFDDTPDNYESDLENLFTSP
ncbi:MAG: sulfur relay protein DsrC [Pseudomonadota bacterium]|nr:sulfur relay protein DsrC [Pseudomonadota bacterium]|tara:strand:+ start:4951 stop:5136 length:186 start_codon:yes stop_codon:yes gene_type:complete